MALATKSFSAFVDIPLVRMMRVGAHFRHQLLANDRLGLGRVAADPFRQSLVSQDETAREIPLPREKLRARYEHGGNSFPLLQQNFPAGLQLEPGNPGLDSPHSVELPLLE